MFHLTNVHATTGASTSVSTLTTLRASAVCTSRVTSRVSRVRTSVTSVLYRQRATINKWLSKVACRVAADCSDERLSYSHSIYD